MFDHFSFLISLMPCRFLSIPPSKREIIINSRCARTTRKKGKEEWSFDKLETFATLVSPNALFGIFPSSTSLPIPPHPSSFNYDNANLFEPFGFFAQFLSRDKSPKKRNFRPPPRNSPLYRRK